MKKKRSRLFQLIIIIFIFAIIYLSAIINSYSLRRNTMDADAGNTAAALSMVMERSEYGLKYGRELENYYGIDEVLLDIKRYCDAEHIFITNEEGEYLYGEEPPESLHEYIRDMENAGDRTQVYEEGEIQYIVHSILGKENVEGYVGIAYARNRTLSISDKYVKSIMWRALFFSLAGCLIFEVLFHVIDHKFDKKKLRWMIMVTISVLSIGTIVSTYFILKRGYEAMSQEVSANFLEQNRANIEKLIDQGLAYSDIKGAEEYFSKIAEKSDQLQGLSLTKSRPGEKSSYVELPLDDFGEMYYLSVVLSEKYISDRVKSAVLNVVVTMVTALMLAGEVLGFLIDIIGGEKKRRLLRVDNKEHKTIESIGVVRGISFFFAGFRFMAVAFMSIVLTRIYRPVTIFGWNVPKEILMSLPMSSQIFISMITSYLSGSFIEKRGWKRAAIGGVAVMIIGTIGSAFASEPVSFIVAQMVMGVGLGFAKMGIDIYAVVVSSNADMSEYTAGSNAAIIVGYSCAASIGAMIASIFGYSGAYIVMSLIGISVLVILIYFGMDVAPRKEIEEEESQIVNKWNGRIADIRFPAYLLCVIIPYYFIIMFVDYFFPVYSDSVGITTDVIGLVMMLYGIATAYIGTVICPKLSKRFLPSWLMSGVLVLLSVSMIIFAVRNAIITAIVTVLLIGIADGIMPSVQFEYVYALPFAKKIGFSKALGIEGFFSNLIGALAPIVFGVVMLYGSGGLILVGVTVILLAVIFILLNCYGRERKAENL